MRCKYCIAPPGITPNVDTAKYPTKGLITEASLYNAKHLTNKPYGPEQSQLIQPPSNYQQYPTINNANANKDLKTIPKIWEKLL